MLIDCAKVGDVVLVPFGTHTVSYMMFNLDPLSWVGLAIKPLMEKMEIANNN